MEHYQAVIKVTFVGAGSIEFTRSVATDLCGYPELRGRLHLALHDISASRLAFAEMLVNRISAQTGAGAVVTATPDRRAALDGARYVINEVQVGGYEATKLDFAIPAGYGVRQTIGDTLGIGGIFRGLRTIPVTMALATDMLAVCPGAYLLTYANPMAMLRSGAPLVLEPGEELASLFINSLETGQERELHVNVRNGDLITSLPADCCVEVPCRVGAGGPAPVPVGVLPPQLAALNRTFLNVVELTVRAVLDGSRDHVYQAALLDPNAAATLTTAQAVAMCDDLFAAHAELLPPGLAP
jgi:alpha-galactosidase/6-phospho-beta-glucosidase family protein